MPETLDTLRNARLELETYSPEMALQIMSSWNLSPKEEFFLIYGDDPAQYVLDVFEWKDGEQPTPYQLDALRILAKHHRLGLMGPHGLGKSAMGSWLVNWMADTREGLVDWKVITTASAWRQLTKYLWPEIHKWSKRKKWKMLGREPYNQRTELTSLALSLDDGQAFAVSSDQHELIEGAHAMSLMYLYDESKKVKDQTFDASEGAASNAGPNTGNEFYGVAISTPGPPAGRFHSIITKKPGYEDWRVREVSLEECIAANRISREWAKARERQWGRNSSIFINRVLGKFASESESSVVPASWIEAAVERWHDVFRKHAEPEMAPVWQLDSTDRPSLDQIGVDVARGGVDDTVFAPRYGYWLRYLYTFPYDDDGKIVATALYNFTANMKTGALDAPSVNIDSMGVGSSVYDHFKDMWPNTEAYVGSHKTFYSDSSGVLRFKNKRSAAYWNMRELLHPETGKDVALPPDDTLLGELSAPTFRELGQGVIQVETKEELASPRRLGKSPNMADGVVLAFWEESDPPRPRPRAITVRR